MKKKLVAVMALAAGSMFAQTRFSIGVNIGGGYRPAVYAAAPVYEPVPAYAPAYVDAAPPCPGPGYTWVDGYWSNPGYGRRVWVAGFWRAPIVRYGYGYQSPRYQRFDRGRSYDRYEDRRDYERQDRRDDRYGRSFRNR